MEKDFAFLFYVNDWAGGTQWLSRLQRGAYLDLLLYQVHNDFFTLDEAKTILGEDFEKCWSSLEKKFIFENNKFYNEKMKFILQARKQFTESRRKNRTGKNRVLNNNISITSEKLMENEDEKEKENIIEIEKENKKIKIPFESENFKNIWSEWLTYRKEIKKPYKSVRSEQAQLIELSKYPEQTAIEMILQSIKNGWQGIFEFKNNQNGSTNSTDKSQQRLEKLKHW